MIDSAALLADTRKQVDSLVDDLRANADRVVLDAEYSAARSAGRTSLPQPQWAEGVFAQVAVSWVLGCVFVRFCEDNRLVSDALISGPGTRRDLAREHRADYLRQNPAHDDRDWLRHVFTVFRGLPATGDIFGDHNPLWLLQPSADGARELVQAFQRINPETGELSHNFTDPEWNTRFLGDLYQDLSEHAKKQFALLQTPVFIEEFILDHTLEPAIKTFGLKDTDLIDPTCGSGHFLLGAFARLFSRWREAEPATNPRELARRAVDAVAGVDINPFAVAIARFRLLLAALSAGGDRRLADAPTYPINIAVGDSLLHTQTQLTLAGIGHDDDVAAASAHGYSTEDIEATRILLSRQWAAVVGNPPYIVVRDPALNELYRKKFKTCQGQYSLGVPFTERFWQLARTSAGSPELSGYTGMITSNAFMKGRFGKNLIERWLPQHDLTHLVDTRGAYIPGHGTPTVILFGRNRQPVAATVRTVMGIRGEPGTPEEPANGLVWSSIVSQIDSPGSTNEFVSTVDLDRRRLYIHPWNIGGGGVAELKDRLDGIGVPLISLVDHIGFTGQTNIDDVFLASRAQHLRYGMKESSIRLLITGDSVRDWTIDSDTWAYFPYDSSGLVNINEDPSALHRIWPFRTSMWARATFGKSTYRLEGRPWWGWHQIALKRLISPLSITFSFVATHNHFCVDNEGSVFNRTAPAMKLSPEATLDDLVPLAGLLNSSTCCFWMKQVSFDKGASIDGAGARISGRDEWDNYFNFDASKLENLPVPSPLPATSAWELFQLSASSKGLLESESPDVSSSRSGSLESSEATYRATREKMIGLQEQLDWEVYSLYSLLSEPLTYAAGEPPLRLGERAFEILLARRMFAGETSTGWFERHGSTPISTLPAEWPTEYRRLVERRIEVIDSDPVIGLIERPEYKRRWNADSWQEQRSAALRGRLLDRLESPSYWSSASITSSARLAALARADADFMVAARAYLGRQDVDVAALVGDLVSAEAVPFLAAMRYTESGLRKWAEWCETWDFQRQEDLGDVLAEVPVPPRYASADFVGVAWTHRGKLDVPKERFVSYPGAESGSDQSLVIGWAGWDHLERARALATFYLSAKRDGRDDTYLTPLLAGLAELVPWLLQWYNEPSSDPALDRPGSQIAGLLDSELRGLHLTMNDLERWRPAPTRRGRQRA